MANHLRTSPDAPALPDPTDARAAGFGPEEDPRLVSPRLRVRDADDSPARLAAAVLMHDAAGAPVAFSVRRDLLECLEAAALSGGFFARAPFRRVALYLRIGGARRRAAPPSPLLVLDGEWLEVEVPLPASALAGPRDRGRAEAGLRIVLLDALARVASRFRLPARSLRRARYRQLLAPPLRRARRRQLLAPPLRRARHAAVRRR